MKPITEDQRKHLISLARIEISRWKVPSDKQYMVDLMEIALASLVADVFMRGISDPDGKAYFSEYCVDDDGSGVSDEVCALNDGETDVDGGYQAVKLYTAPPVPVIKLPEYQKLLTHPAVKSRWNECIDEMKHLNGLGE